MLLLYAFSAFSLAYYTFTNLKILHVIMLQPPLIMIGVGPITVLNRDPSKLGSFITAVEALRANGGGDFPEFALDGMLQGLQAT